MHNYLFTLLIYSCIVGDHLTQLDMSSKKAGSVCSVACDKNQITELFKAIKNYIDENIQIQNDLGSPGTANDH